MLKTLEIGILKYRQSVGEQLRRNIFTLKVNDIGRISYTFR
jgi:hypothetical protein